MVLKVPLVGRFEAAGGSIEVMTAHARIARTRQTHTGHRKADGTLNGRPESALVSRHLLGGHLRCGTCGGGMFPTSRVSTNGKVHLYYMDQLYRESLEPSPADQRATIEAATTGDITDEEAAEEWKAMQLEAASDALAPLDADTVTGRTVLRDLLVEPHNAGRTPRRTAEITSSNHPPFS